MQDYQTLESMTRGLLDPELPLVANLANFAALVMDGLDDVSWAGFYLARTAADGGRELVLGPFQGKSACTRIPFGNGVCGTAAAERRTIVVPNVHEFPGHIACDSASNSEIVVPIFAVAGDRCAHADVVGVLDLDSTSFERFGVEDAAGLEALVRALEGSVSSWEGLV